MSKPFKLDGESAGGAPSEGTVTSVPSQREARSGALPSNPLADAQPGAQRTLSGWAPGIGQNSAEIRKGSIPWPKVPPGDSAGKE